MKLVLNEGKILIDLNSLSAIKKEEAEYGTKYMFFVGGQIISYTTITASDNEAIKNALREWRNI